MNDIVAHLDELQAAAGIILHRHPVRLLGIAKARDDNGGRAAAHHANLRLSGQIGGQRYIRGSGTGIGFVPAAVHCRQRPAGGLYTEGALSRSRFIIHVQALDMPARIGGVTVHRHRHFGLAGQRTVQLKPQMPGGAFSAAMPPFACRQIDGVQLLIRAVGIIEGTQQGGKAIIIDTELFGDRFFEQPHIGMIRDIGRIGPVRNAVPQNVDAFTAVSVPPLVKKRRVQEPRIG